MIKSRLQRFLTIFFLISLSFNGFSQNLGDYSKSDIRDFTSKVEDQIRFLEYFFNTLGSKDTPARDKDVIIRESYLKIFRDSKVQVEDDLLLDRKVITNKDIPAYLKDIDFFFKDAEFKFKVREIKPFLRDNGELSFLVSMDRTLTAEGLNQEKITNTKPRFVEINLDKRSNELKIASMYTTKLSRDEELAEWWEALSYTWSSYFRDKIGLTEEDSVTLDHLYKISSIDTIDFSGNEYIIDLGPIEALRELKYIDISNTRIEELNPISNVTFLSHLDISNTPTSDIQFIKYSDHLKHLDISGTMIEDIEELGNLKTLESLVAVETPITSFGVLNSFSSLKSLDLSSSGFNNVENIAELDDLEYLSLADNFLMNTEMLSNLVNLKAVNLSATNIVDLNPLAELQKLELINFNQTEVSDLNPLIGLPNLRKVYADRTRVSEEDADEFSRKRRTTLLIHHVETLQSWWDGLPREWKDALKNNNAELRKEKPSIEELSMAVGVDSLNISKTQIQSLAPVIKFRKLNFLSFDSTLVTDLTPISEMKTLLAISGKNTKVTNLSPLSNLPDLRYLNFSNSSVNNFMRLKELPNLRYLNLDETEIDQNSVPEFLMANPEVNLIFRSAFLRDWWANTPPVWKESIGTFFGKGDSDPDIELLHRWTASTSIEVEGVDIYDLFPLHAFINLRSLSVANVPMTNIEDLRELKLLQSLSITHAPVSDVMILSVLEKLKSLDLSYTGIEDLRQISQSLNLESLVLTGTNVKVLRGLETLYKLKHLDVAGTNVRSLKPVQGLNLEKLICFNTRINQRAVDGFKKLNPNCDVRFY